MIKWKYEEIYYDGNIEAYSFEDKKFFISIAKYTFEELWGYHILDKMNKENVIFDGQNEDLAVAKSECEEEYNKILNG